nr:MAG TPA: hypothetical protein [Caudoviricetes sp.]
MLYIESTMKVSSENISLDGYKVVEEKGKTKLETSLDGYKVVEEKGKTKLETSLDGYKVVEETPKRKKN